MPQEQTLERPGVAVEASAHAEHRITFAPAGVTLACAPGQSVLETALGAGYFPKHSCRRGECHACCTPIKSGSVSYPEGFVPEGVPEGYCLTCMARPEGQVEIEAPEVSSVPGRRVVRAGARVLSTERVSHDVTVVQLQVPRNAGFDFSAGQYCDVLLRDGNRRSYSMASAPDGSGVIEWHVRALPNGRFSTHVYKALKPGDMLRVEGPFGGFALSTSDKPVILLASGTGYAPIAALLKTHAEVLKARGAALYWGCRRLEDLYAFEEARAWGSDGDHCRFIPVLSEHGSNWSGRSGFVHDAVAQDFPDMSGMEVYACGNPLMVDAARATFTREHALPNEAFFSDAFITVMSHPRAAP